MAWRNRGRRWRGGWQPSKAKPRTFDYRQTDIDELLELIYTLMESNGEITVEKLKMKNEQDADVDELLSAMTVEGLVTSHNNIVTFTEYGRAEAQKLIRAHRLAERLLTDVLLVEKELDIENQACEMEHVLKPEIVDNICTILGHPRTCPHGHEIPPGACCADRKRTAAPAVLTLDELRSGESGRILYVETTDHARLDKLTTFGMLPGTIVRVHQRQPSLVVLVGETQLAIDREIAQNIHVVKTE